MYHFYAINKMDEEKRLVYGYASTEAVDVQGETVTLDAMKAAWDDYMKFANVREMHGNSAAGIVKSYSFDDKGVFIEVEVVDDSAWEKVKKGVYKGFSIGGKKLKDGYDKITKTITGLKLTEISLVDRPANPEALFTMYKMDGAVVDDESAVDLEAVEKYLATEQGQSIIAKAVADALAKAAKGDEKSDSKDGKYGDVKYADTKNDKYPVDTEKHIRAAWSYINMPKNQKGYTTAEVAAIKANIVSAWKSKIDKDGPPSMAKFDGLSDIQKALYTLASTDEEEIKKGLYAVSSFSDCLMSLSYLQSGACMEAAYEGDDSPMPAKLADLVSQAGALLLEMATEEVGELIASMKNPDGTQAVEILQLMVKNSKCGEDVAKLHEVNDILKAGARNSQADKGRIQKAHDLMTELGAECDTAEENDEAAKLAKAHNHEHTEVTALDIVKMEKMAGELGTLRKTHDETVQKYDDLQKSYTELKEKYDNLPTQPKGALRVVEKTGNVEEEVNKSEQEVQPVLKADGSVDEVATEIKKVYAGGGRKVMGPSGLRN